MGQWQPMCLEIGLNSCAMLKGIYDIWLLMFLDDLQLLVLVDKVVSQDD